MAVVVVIGYRMVVGFLTIYAIPEILLKVALNTITPSMVHFFVIVSKLSHVMKTLILVGTLKFL